MAASANSGSLFLTLFLAIALNSFTPAANADPSYTYPPLAKGLDFSYYKSTCPQVEPIVRNYLTNVFKTNIGLAAGLLRLHFHDCFVQVR
jgi:peroxidase